MNRWSVHVGILAVLTTIAVTAAPLPPNIAVDENGNLFVNDVLSSGFFSDDPGPGGLTGVLTYNLPFAGTQGDVALVDFGCGCLSDIIRFNGDGTLIFYSENFAGLDSLADTVAPPQNLYDNLVIIPEFGDDIFSSAMYTPFDGDPGFDVSNPNYTFVSEETVPEPSSVAMLLMGLGGLWYVRFRRQRTRRVINEASGHPSSVGRAADS